MRDKIIWINGYMVLLTIIIIILCVLLSVKNTPQTIAPEYGIYEYHYEETSIYRYKENVAIYEYSRAELHIASVNGETILFKYKDQALEFMYTYLEDIKREDLLR